MSELLVWAVAGGAVIGAATAGYGAYASADAQQQQSEFNSRMAKKQSNQELANAAAAANQANAAAGAKEQETDANAMLMRRRNASILAQNRADAGMLGFDSTGSSLLFDLEQAENAEIEVGEFVRQGRYDASLLRYQGELASFEHKQKAENYKLESSFSKSQAKSAGVSKWVGGSLGLVSGAMSGAGAGASLYNAGTSIWNAMSVVPKQNALISTMALKGVLI